jgi:hypothetical protein
MRKLNIYYTEGTFGCTLTADYSEKEALQEVANNVGIDNIFAHHLATKDEISDVLAMGGGAGLEDLLRGES